MKSLKSLLISLTVLVMLIQTTSPAEAHRRYDDGDGYLNKALIGAGVGALIGAGLADEGYRTRGAAKGAMIGAGGGLAYEAIRRNTGSNRNRYRYDRPYYNNSYYRQRNRYDYDD